MEGQHFTSVFADGAKHLSDAKPTDISLFQMGYPLCPPPFQDIDKFADALSRSPKIESIRLIGVSFTDKETAILQGVLQSHPGIRHITLSTCSFGSNNGRFISTILVRNAHVRTMVCHCIAVGNAGAQTVAAALHFTNVQTLVLRRCGLGPDGVRALADAMASNGTIMHFGLQENALKEGVLALHDMLWKNTTLRALDLTDVQMTTSALVDKLLAGLLHNSTLQTLAISQNRIVPDVLVAFGKGLGTHPSLTTIFYTGPEDSGQLLADVLKINPKITVVKCAE